MKINTIDIKIAGTKKEFQQIHRLNYATFVREIPQHPPTAQALLVDRFHDRNHYMIALKGHAVIGMVSACFERPFSLDGKIPYLNDYLPRHKKIAEIRLLSIHPDYRKKKLFPQLALALYDFLIDQHTDILIASGYIRELKLYGHLGFKPFGPVVGEPPAVFQPIMLDLLKVRHYADKFRS